MTPISMPGIARASRRNPLAILTTLWQGEIDTLDGLRAALAPGQSANDVAAFVEELIEQGLC